MSENNSGHPMSTTRTNITGNAETASKLASARNISMTGPDLISTSAIFDGSSNVSLNLNGRLCVDLKNSSANTSLSTKYNGCYFYMNGGSYGSLGVNTVRTSVNTAGSTTNLDYVKGRVALYIDESTIIPVDMTLQKHNQGLNNVWVGDFMYNHIRYSVLAVIASNNQLRIIFFKSRGVTNEIPAIPTGWSQSNLKEAVGVGFRYYDETTNLEYELGANLNWSQAGSSGASVQSNWFVTCSTAADLKDKTMTSTGFSFAEGSVLSVLFTLGSSVTSTLTVNGISRPVSGHTVLGYINPGGIVDFVYKGNDFHAKEKATDIRTPDLTDPYVDYDGFTPNMSSIFTSGWHQQIHSKILRAGLAGKDLLFKTRSPYLSSTDYKDLHRVANIKLVDLSPGSVLMTYDISSASSRTTVNGSDIDIEEDDVIRVEVLCHSNEVNASGIFLSGGFSRLELLERNGVPENGTEIWFEVRSHKRKNPNKALFIFLEDIQQAVTQSNMNNSVPSLYLTKYNVKNAYSSYSQMLGCMQEASLTGRPVVIVSESGGNYNSIYASNAVYYPAKLTIASKVLDSTSKKEFLLTYERLYNSSSSVKEEKNICGFVYANNGTLSFVGKRIIS